MPKKTQPATVDKKLLKQFIQVMADLRTENDSQHFFTDFFTESEQAMFAKRLVIASELRSGKSYEKIRKEYGVSTATISQVASMLSSVGMQVALKKIENDHWADTMAKKMLAVFQDK